MHIIGWQCFQLIFTLLTIMCSICIKVIHIAYNYTFYISVHHLCVCVTKIDTASPSFQHLQRLKVAISGGVVSRCGRNSRVPSDHRLPPTYLYNTIHIPTTSHRRENVGTILATRLWILYNYIQIRYTNMINMTNIMKYVF